MLLCRTLPVAPDTAADFTESTLSRRLNHVSYDLYSGHNPSLLFSPPQSMKTNSIQADWQGRHSPSPPRTVYPTLVSHHTITTINAIALAKSPARETQQIP